ncbi:MAG: outer membrane lipoprotein carrier protein LolA [Thermodesulfovibrionales bacterium]
MLLFWILTSVFCILTSPSFASQADDEVSRIQKAYEGIKDVSGGFTQKSYIKDLRRTDNYKGEFAIKPPMMKWDYKGERPQAVYITGEDIVIYQKKEGQAFKGKFDRAIYGQSPLALLGGMGKISSEFNVSMKEARLVLKPKKSMGNVTRIEIIPSSAGEFPIAALTIIDSLSNRIDIQLRDVKVNTGIAERSFRFSPPPGVTVIEQ